MRPLLLHEAPAWIANTDNVVQGELVVSACHGDSMEALVDVVHIASQYDIDRVFVEAHEGALGGRELEKLSSIAEESEIEVRFVVRHQPILSSRGFRVDHGIVVFLEHLWDVGYATRFSCQEMYVGAAQVIFDDMAGAALFRSELDAAGICHEEQSVVLDRPELFTGPAGVFRQQAS